MKFGLSPQQQTILINILSKYIHSGKVIVYGSRAKDTFTPQSDLDLVIQKCETDDRQLLGNIQTAIEESDFPYLVDIQFFEKNKNPALIAHIQRVGKVLYQINAD